MVAIKKLAAVAAGLFLALAVVAGAAAWSTVYAEETDEAVLPFTQFEMANTAEDTTSAEDSAQDVEVTLTEDEIPMAEAAVNVLEAHTETKGMNSFLGFLLVAVAAGAAGGAVALRARFGGKKRGYVPAKDLTLLKFKK